MQHVFGVVCYFILLKCISVCILQRLTSPPPLLHRLLRQDREDMGREHAAAGRRAERSHEPRVDVCVGAKSPMFLESYGGDGCECDDERMMALMLFVAMAVGMHSYVFPLLFTALFKLGLLFNFALKRNCCVVESVFIAVVIIKMTLIMMIAIE